MVRNFAFQPFLLSTEWRDMLWGKPLKHWIDVYVCITCDREARKVDTPEAEGRGFAAAVRKLLAAEQDVKVRSVKCLGGCECPKAGAVNGCCSVGFAGTGRFSYVFNLLKPEHDGWKVLEFLRLYRMRPNGRIACADSSRRAELAPHLATRVPPARN